MHCWIVLKGVWWVHRCLLKKLEVGGYKDGEREWLECVAEWGEGAQELAEEAGGGQEVGCNRGKGGTGVR